MVKLPAVPFTLGSWCTCKHLLVLHASSWCHAKDGAYGMLRIPIAIFPDAVVYYQDVIMAIGLISLVWGSIVCLGQTNLKKMVAYSSVSHMGVIAGMQACSRWICCSILHDVRSRNHLAYAVRCLWCIQAPLPLYGNWCNAWNGQVVTFPCSLHDVRLDGKPWLPLLAGFVAELMVMIAFWPEYGWWILLPGAVLAITAAYYSMVYARTIFEGGDEGQPPESSTVRHLQTSLYPKT